MPFFLLLLFHPLDFAREMTIFLEKLSQRTTIFLHTIIFHHFTEKLFFLFGQLPFFFFTAIVSIKYHLCSYFCRIIQIEESVLVFVPKYLSTSIHSSYVASILLFSSSIISSSMQLIGSFVISISLITVFSLYDM